MKTLINRTRFLKAIEYTSEHYFSKPYSISPMVDRWFNQLAMVELEGKKQPLHIHLSNRSDLANFPVDVVVDGEIIPKNKIALILKFHSSKSTHEAERSALVLENEKLSTEWEALDAGKKQLAADLLLTPDDEDLKARATEQDELIAKYHEKRAAIQTVEAFDGEKAEAAALYASIVAKITIDEEELLKDPTYEPKVKSVINIAAIEAQQKARVVNIIHRPNHGLAHSARAGYSITAIHAFREEHGRTLTLDSKDLEKLQLMMLFSVVGRKDETGFADTGNNLTGSATYAKFRTGSGRAYLQYCLSPDGEPLYHGSIEEAYKDAIVVELMGYSGIDNAIKRKKIPEVLLDYVIRKEQLSTGEQLTREAALTKVKSGEYSLDKLFPSGPIRDKSSNMLVMMNDAHGLDLTRCYPLFPTSNQGAKSIGILNYHLWQSGFPDTPDETRLVSFFQLMRTSFNTLEKTGQNSMFGLLSQEEFEAQKDDLLREVKAILDYCQDSSNHPELLKRAARDNAADDSVSYFTSKKTDENGLLDDYYYYLIVRAVSEKLCGVVEYYLGKSQLLQFTDEPIPEKLDQFHTLLGNSYNTIPGKTILDADAYAAQKNDILKEMKRISDDFKNPSRASDLLNEAKIAAENTANPFKSNASSDKELLRDYRNFQIANAVYQELTGSPLRESLKTKLNSDSRMFEFQHPSGEGLTQFDNHQNALDLVCGLEKITPYKGLEQNELPKIYAVKHQRAESKVMVCFDAREEAEVFLDSYQAMYNIRPETVENDGFFFIQIDRSNYRKMLTDRLIEFKQVNVPKKIEREDFFVDEQGEIDALSLIAHNRALVRTVSTTALNGEDFPDYDYLLKAFDDPVHERYTPALKEIDKFPLDPGRYYDPRSGKAYSRTIVEATPVELRFQEPTLEPASFADKQMDGLTVRQQGRGGPKNTIYTKKLAHTLLPDHGKIIPFAGYVRSQHLYFPIGVLSDVTQVDLKDERYIWAQNMVTANKFWIRDPSVFKNMVYSLLNAEVNEGALLRHSNGVAKLNQEAIRQFDSKDNLILYLEAKAKKLAALLDEKYYRPSDEDLNDFKKLVAQQRQAYLKQIKHDPHTKEYAKKINTVFAKMNERIDLEGQRKGLKYAITLRELIAHQKKSEGTDAHNEILVGNTKKAIRAFYATKDTLFDRLNIALHSIRIKEQYGYDVPLLVMSQDKPPYNYTEAMVKNDLQEAYTLLREGKFPFDRTLFKQYEYDDTGKVVFKGGTAVVKLNERGKEIQEPKNQKMQQDVLLNFFKIGLPELSTFQELRKGKIGARAINDKEVASAIDRIMVKMNFIGGLKRETERMERILAGNDQKAKEQFFIRACALGHESLIDKMLAELKPPMRVLEKASRLLEKNNQASLKNKVDAAIALLKEGEIEVLLAQRALQAPIVDGERQAAYKERIKGLPAVIEKFNTLRAQTDISEELQEEMAHTMETVLLNSSSKTSENSAQLPKLLHLLTSNEEYSNAYITLLESGKPINCAATLAEQEHYGPEAVHLVELQANNDEASKNYYKALIDASKLDLAAQFKEFAIAHPGEALNALYAESSELISYIQKNSTYLDNRKEIEDFCNIAQAHVTEKSLDVFESWQKLTATKQEISDLAIDQLQEEVAEFERLLDSPSKDPAVHEQRIEKLLSLTQRYEALKSKATIPELEIRLYKTLSAQVLLNEAWRKSLSPDSKSVATLYSLVNKDENIIKLLAQVRAYNLPVPLDSIMDSYHDVFSKSPEQAKELVVNAFSLGLHYGNTLCSNYLILQNKYPSFVTSFLRIMKEGIESLANILKPGITVEQAQKNSEDLVSCLQNGQDTQNFNDFIRKQAEDLGIEDKYKEANEVLLLLEVTAKNNPKDAKLNNFCIRWRANLEESRTKKDYLALIDTKKLFDSIHESINSPEVTAVNNAIKKLESRVKGFLNYLDVGNQRKANSIQTALYNVELEDRIHVFSNPKSIASCQKVIEELSVHRKFANPFKSDQRANSVIEVEKELSHKERLANARSDKAENKERRLPTTKS